MSERRRRTPWVLASTSMIVGLLLASCTGGGEPAARGAAATGATVNGPADAKAEAEPTEPESAGTFGLSKASCSYSGPPTLEAGEVLLQLSSVGGTADFDLWRLDEGHTYPELVSHIDEERRRSEAGEPPLGHPTFATLVAEASTDADGVGSLTTTLEDGVYGMACIRFDEETGGIWAAGPFTV